MACLLKEETSYFNENIKLSQLLILKGEGFTHIDDTDPGGMFDEIEINDYIDRQTKFVVSLIG